MGKADDYIEKLVAEAYKRESDQEENVFRSLPFFATTFGVLGTAIGLARPAIGHLDGSPIAVSLYALLALIGVVTAAGLFFLFQAIRRRDFVNPMRESDLLLYRKELEAFYVKTEAPAGTVDAAIAADIQEAIVAQLAQATETTRRNNLLRLQARSRAATALIVAISLVFALMGLILTRDATEVGATNVGSTTRSAGTPGSAGDQGSRDRASDPKTDPAGDAAWRPGGVDSSGRSTEGNPP